MKRNYKQRSDIKDISNQVFFDLTAIKPIESEIRGKIWLCKCICGNQCLAYGGHLRAGKRKSCGCRSEARIEESGINKIYANYKRKALIKKREFNLEKNYFEKLIKAKCFYCGTDPSQNLLRQKSRKLQIAYNGIDRIDSNLGYIKENCVTSCRICNQAKSDLTFEEFKNHIRRVTKWLSIDF